MFSEKELNLEETELRERVRNLPDSQRRRYLAMEQARLRSSDTYRLLNWFFLLGLNHFYLHRWLRGGINLLASVLAFYLWFFTEMRGYPALILVALVLIEIPQTLNARHLVHHFNNRVMYNCLRSATNAPSASDTEEYTN